MFRRELWEFLNNDKHVPNLGGGVIVSRAVVGWIGMFYSQTKGSIFKIECKENLARCFQVMLVELENMELVTTTLNKRK